MAQSINAVFFHHDMFHLNAAYW